MANKETMTSRERVIKALNHEEPDRVPIDLGGFQTGIHKGAYTQLLDYLGIGENVLGGEKVSFTPSEAPVGGVIVTLITCFRIYYGLDHARPFKSVEISFIVGAYLVAPVLDADLDRALKINSVIQVFTDHVTG